MTIKELLTNWLMESKNEQYLATLASNNTDTNSDENITTAPEKPEKSTNSLQIKPFFQTKRNQTFIEAEIKTITVKFQDILSKKHKNKAGLNKQEFETVTVDICGFSRYCNSLLLNKILSVNTIEQNEGNNIVTLPMFIKFWKECFSENEEISFRFIQILSNSNNYLTRDDFVPLIKGILFTHPGLEFLSSSVDFHQFYIDTVICRIFYHLDTNKNEQISVRELRRSNFLDILSLLDEELDINEIFDYFSYEHFYVIYTKFWELDEDNNNLLTENDLMKYNDYALTPKAIHRILNGHATYTNRMKKDKTQMNYCEFVDFIISEEDKTSVTSLNYWFRILDLGNDGVLTEYELKAFFEEQSAKLLQLCGETILFDNILVSLNDMISPKVPFQFTLSDIKKSKMGQFFFDTLTNINKFALREHKDIESINRIRNSPHMTDWDRFASEQYFILSNS